MNKLSILALLLAAACSKSGGDADVRAMAASAKVAPPTVAAPSEKTGVLDLELQLLRTAGGGDQYRLQTPRISLDFNQLPQVSAKDIPGPDGTPLPTAMAMVEGSDRASGLMYMPIPKDRTYDVTKGIEGARDGFMKPFDPGFKMTHEPAKLGPFDAMHMTADGTRRGTRTHMEAWIAWDATAHSMYTVMAIRMGDDLAGIDALARTFALRDGQTVGAPPAAAAPAPATP